MTNIENNTQQTVDANVKQNSTTDKKNSTTKRKNKLNPVYAVLGRARRQFARQVDKNVETKIKCIQANIATHYADHLRFWLDLKTEANILLDSKRFCLECESKEVRPNYVAEHLVFEGKKIVEKVRKEGVINYGENIIKFNGPLFTDKENLYNREDSEQPSSKSEVETDSNIEG